MRKIDRGVLLGLWAVLHVGAYVLIARSGWPSGHAAPAHPLSTPLLVAMAAAAFVVPIAVVAAWRSGERRLGIDRDAVDSSMRWCRRAMSTPRSIAILAATALLFILAAALEDLWFLALPAVVFLLSLPLGILNEQVMAADTGEGWWKPRWPGTRTFLAVIGIVLAAIVAEVVLDAIGRLSPATQVPAVLAGSALGVVTTIAVASVLLFRRPRVSWRNVGLAVAIEARLFFLALFPFVTILTAAVLLWTLIPGHAAWAAARGTMLPWSARALVAVSHVIGQSGEFLALLLFGVPLWLWMGRALWVSNQPARLPLGTGASGIASTGVMPSA